MTRKLTLIVICLSLFIFSTIVYVMPYKQYDPINNIDEIIMLVDHVNFDKQTNSYYMYCIDENEEIYIIEIANTKENYLVLCQVCNFFQTTWIIATVENYLTKDLYDDEIIDWRIERGLNE